MPAGDYYPNGLPLRDLDALRNVPEARIAHAFPAIPSVDKVTVTLDLSKLDSKERATLLSYIAKAR